MRLLDWELITRTPLISVEVIYNLWEEIWRRLPRYEGRKRRGVTETKVRRRPERKGNKVITGKWCWQTVLCVSSVSHCRGERPISALCSTLIPPSHSPSAFICLYRSHLASQVWYSAVVHTEGNSCLSRRAHRQELLHHPALTGGKTAQTWSDT